VIKNSVGARWKPMSADSEIGGSSGGTTRVLSIYSCVSEHGKAGSWVGVLDARLIIPSIVD